MALVDEVKNRSDIVQVISDYVDLDSSSRQPKALCPFHSERTPSFVIYPETGNWHCFGSCAEGGDVISFLMKRENMSFTEAVNQLAARAGIKVEERKNEPKAKPVEGLVAANEVAAKYYKSRLGSPAGESAREYLTDRGIDMLVAERRGLGLAPSGIETLAGHLRTQSVQARAARDAGLITRKDDGSWQDMFRGRLTIEIRDARDRIIGFGARTLDGSEPKYLNTAQTQLFEKSNVLYGLNWAREAIRTQNEAIVVEGYMDVITAQEHGFQNVVASMGTAVTGQQLDTLARYATSGGEGKIVLCLDSDAAGEVATLRALEGVSSELASGRRKNLDVRVARPDGGKDPDEAIRSDADSWRASLNDAEPLLQYLIAAKSKLHNLESGEGIAAFANEIAPLIFNVSNDYDRDRYWSAVAKVAGITEQRLKTLVEPPRRRNAWRRRGENRTRNGNAQRISSQQAGRVIDETTGDRLEEHLLALILQRDDLRDHVIAMPDEYIHESDNRALFTAWKSSTTLDEISEQLGDELTEKVHLLANRELPPSDQQMFIDDVGQCVSRLKERHFRQIKRLQTEQLKQSEGEETKELIDRSLHPNENLRNVMTGRA